MVYPTRNCILNPLRAMQLCDHAYPYNLCLSASHQVHNAHGFCMDRNSASNSRGAPMYVPADIYPRTCPGVPPSRSLFRQEHSRKARIHGETRTPVRPSSDRKACCSPERWNQCTPQSTRLSKPLYQEMSASSVCRNTVLSNPLGNWGHYQPGIDDLRGIPLCQQRRNRRYFP